jgi:hypothetical protein
VPGVVHKERRSPAKGVACSGEREGVIMRCDKSEFSVTTVSIASLVSCVTPHRMLDIDPSFDSLVDPLKFDSTELT